MAYTVRIAARAERDLDLLYGKIHAFESGAAREWYQGLKQAVLSLSELPRRCPVTRENSKLRHLLYGGKPHSYRIIYRINEKRRQVDVLHIWHGARRQFGTADMA